MRPLRLAPWLLLLTFSLACSGAPTAEPQAPETQPAEAAAKADESKNSDAFVKPAADYLASGDSPVIAAKALAADLANPEAPKTLIIDIRDKDEHFAAGHIAGAVHMPYPMWANAETYQDLAEPDTRVVVVCHTGHKASLLTMQLRQRGYEAYALKHGMMGWNSDPAIVGVHTYCEEEAPAYPTTTEAVEAQLHEIPSHAEVADLSQILPALERPVVSPKALAESMNDGEGEGYFVLDIRKGEHYKAGHIAGAVHVPYPKVLDELAQLPAHRPIVVACYSGHKGSQIAGLLRQLGYEAYALKYGMMGWNPDPSMVPAKALPSCKADLPVESGTP